MGRKKDKYGFINKTGKIVVPLQCDTVFPFKENLATVNQDGEFFSINKQSERVD